MRKLVSTIVGIAFLVSTIISGLPGSAVGADSEDVPTGSWPHTITTEEATIVLYPPQAIAWEEHRSLEARMAVEVTKKGTRVKRLTSSTTHRPSFTARSLPISSSSTGSP